MSQFEYTNKDHSEVKNGDSKTIMVNGVDVSKLTFFGRRKLKKNMKIKERKENEIKNIEAAKDGSDSILDRVYQNRIRHLDNQINIIDRRIENALARKRRPIKLRFGAINVIADLAMYVYNKYDSFISKFKDSDKKSEEEKGNNIDVHAFAHNYNEDVQNQIDEGFDAVSNAVEEENQDDNDITEENENNNIDNEFTNIEVDEVDVPDFDENLGVSEPEEETKVTDIDDDFDYDTRNDIQIPMEREKQEIVAPLNITKDDLTKVFDDYMQEAKTYGYEKHGENFEFEASDLEYDEDNQQAIKDAYNEYQERQDKLEEEVNRRYLEQIPEGTDLNKDQETQIKDALRKQIKAEEEAQKVKEELEKAEKEALEAERSVEEAKNKYTENILKNIEIGINKIGEEKEKYTLSIDKTHNKTQALEQEKELFINKQNEIDSQKEEEISQNELNSMLDEAVNMDAREDTMVK